MSDYEAEARGIVEQALSKAVWNASRQQAIIEPLVPAIAAAIREAVEKRETEIETLLRSRGRFNYAKPGPLAPMPD